MRRNNLNNLILFSLFCLILAGCRQSDDQRQFEDEAFVEPKGITEVSSVNGKTISEDKSDWNISPMYRGRIAVSPASPNPADFNSYFIIDVDILGLETVNYIKIQSFRFPTTTPNYVDELDQSMIHVGVNSVTISTSSITGGAGNASGIYRILIFDGRNNIITYGDVRVR